MQRAPMPTMKCTTMMTKMMSIPMMASSLLIPLKISFEFFLCMFFLVVLVAWVVHLGITIMLVNEKKNDAMKNT
jgi:hypothetical protein